MRGEPFALLISPNSGEEAEMQMAVRESSLGGQRETVADWTPSATLSCDADSDADSEPDGDAPDWFRVLFFLAAVRTRLCAAARGQ